MRQYLIPLGFGTLLTALLFSLCHSQCVGVVQELIAWILPASIPDSGYAVVVDGLAAGLLALPGLTLVVILDRGINRP